MADLGTDTAVVAVAGDGARYTAHISDEWEIWGPCGGYVASVALRAAGAATRFERPASFACHYLGVAAFDAVELEVTSLRAGRTTESLRVSMTQSGRPILDAMVLTVDANHVGLQHDVTEMPIVPEPRSVASVAERMAELGESEPMFRFWNNIDSRPIQWRDDWPPTEPLDPVWRQWERFVPTATFDDPWIDASRALMWIDVGGWPAASGHHAWKDPPWVAVNVDLYAAFHAPRPESEYLLLDATAPIAADGLIGYTSRVWEEDSTLVASGGGQLLCRPRRAVPNADLPDA
jgi:acyl-CoA thioesterase-2